MTLSAGAHVKGTIEDIRFGDLLVYLTIRVQGIVVAAVIHKADAERLELRNGDLISADVKDTTRLTRGTGAFDRWNSMVGMPGPEVDGDYVVAAILRNVALEIESRWEDQTERGSTDPARRSRERH